MLYRSFNFPIITWVTQSAVAANQDYNAQQQLTDGIRMLQVQAHKTSNGTVHLCHTSCVSCILYTFWVVTDEAHKMFTTLRLVPSYR